MNTLRRLYWAVLFIIAGISVCYADVHAPEETVGQVETAAVAPLPVSYFSKIRNDMGDFLMLDINESGGLRLNRKVWQIPKKNKELRLSEIVAEVRKRWPGMSDDIVNRDAKHAFDREMNQGDEAAAFFRFEKKVFTGGGSGNWGEEGRRVYNFNSHDFQGRLTVLDKKEVNIRLMDLSGDIAPGVLTVVDDGYGRFSLFIFLSAKGPLLNIKQDLSGEISIEYFQDGAFFTRTAASFQKLLSSDEPFLRGKVFPVLTHIGIRLPRL